MKRGKILVVDDNQGIRSALKRVSGYRPQLDSIHIYHRTEYITKEIKTVAKPKRWGIGLQAGYGVSFSNKQIQATPYIGIGISYNILTW